MSVIFFDIAGDMAGKMAKNSFSATQLVRKALQLSIVNTSDRYKPLPTVVRPPNIIGETFISTPGVCRTRMEREFPTRPNIVTTGISAPCNSFHKYSQARE